VFITKYKELSWGNNSPLISLSEIHLGGMEIARQNLQEKNTDAHYLPSSEDI
jgi:hypothetical protein